MNCDTCGVTVSTSGYLGGGLVCRQCSSAKVDGDVETLRERIEQYGGGDEYNGQDVSGMVY